MNASIDSDIVIIGGGIAGVGCAAMSAAQCRITLLETEASCGYHASGRSAAIFIPGYGGSQIRQLSALGEDYLQRPPDALDTASLLSPRGELMLALAGEEDDMSALLAAAPDIVELTVDDAVAMVPILARAPIRRACIEQGARDIDANRLLQSWLRMARRAGARIETGQAVQRITRERGCWRIDTRQASYRAAVVVNAAGAWADPIAALAGLGALGLQPHRRSAALLPAPGGHEVSGWPLFGSVNETWYARPESGKLMVSPADEDPVPPHDAFTDDRVLAEGLHRYEQAVTEPVTRVEHQWAGLRTFAPDRVPVVGFDPRAEGFFWLAGQGGYGIQTAPALSALAGALLSGQTPGEESASLAPALHPLRLIDAGEHEGEKTNR